VINYVLALQISALTVRDSLTWDPGGIDEWWRRKPVHFSTMTSCWWCWRHDIRHTGACTIAAVLLPWPPLTAVYLPVHVINSDTSLRVNSKL